MTSSAEESFEEALSGAVDEAFSTLGDSAKQAVYWYVTSKPGILKEELASEIDAFSTALEAFFGSGSFVIEMLILQSLSSRTGIALRQQDHGKFVDTVKRMRREMSRHSESRPRPH